MNPEHRAIRFAALKELGCMVARLRGLDWVGADIHHQLTTGFHGNGKRLGDEFTVALNPYSHDGKPFNGWTLEECRAMFGPSYKLHAREFRETFGSDEELLDMQNQLLRSYLRSTFVCCPYKP